ncbi:hypothetical protein SmJEL517_g02629 [Synchytrium microbalum]|uniref:Endoplasmic reticulum junction formation protein lunapark n=1 Tax=Synchytrium microbalum TaxID=1806994 RepID=A0A507C1D0_9FUNG|nr:uncharacterized protein SmJEL517_g02629 [Synchytrium microbalum]TPX34907.1 hypothetical protein SmJEL517_g02629 [Synchytrium microbalum]
MRLRERQTLYSWLYYSLPSYLVVLLVYFKFMHPEQDPWETWLLKSAPVLVGPLVIYFVRKLISFSFSRYRGYEEMRLENLKTRQKATVEELKKKTKFYATKELIERYETPVKSKDQAQMKNGGQARPAGPMPLNAPGNPSSLPNNPAGLTKKNPYTRDTTHVDGSRPPQPSAATPFSRPPQPPPSISQIEASSMPGSSPLMPQTSIQSVQQEPFVYQTMPIIPQQPMQRNWYDKIVDAIVGDMDSPNSRYALICRYCFTHNGLVLPEEYSNIKFKCMSCGGLNQHVPTTTSTASNPNESRTPPLPSLHSTLSSEDLSRSAESLQLPIVESHPGAVASTEGEEAVKKKAKKKKKKGHDEDVALSGDEASVAE